MKGVVACAYPVRSGLWYTFAGVAKSAAVLSTYDICSLFCFCGRKTMLSRTCLLCIPVLCASTGTDRPSAVAGPEHTPSAPVRPDYKSPRLTYMQTGVCARLGLGVQLCGAFWPLHHKRLGLLLACLCDTLSPSGPAFVLTCFASLPLWWKRAGLS